MNDPDDLLEDKINLETSRINWCELERHFAAGRLIWIDKSLDLVKVARAFNIDDATATKYWIENEQLAHVSDDQARKWQQADQALWAVVVKPWVLVQDRD